jgi:hypothetical protein
VNFFSLCARYVHGRPMCTWYVRFPYRLLHRSNEGFISAGDRQCRKEGTGGRFCITRAEVQGKMLHVEVFLQWNTIVAVLSLQAKRMNSFTLFCSRFASQKRCLTQFRYFLWEIESLLLSFRFLSSSWIAKYLFKFGSSPFPTFANSWDVQRRPPALILGLKK